MAKKRKSSAISKLEKEYMGIVPKARHFADEILHQLEHLLAENPVSLGFPIQSRVKTWSSISEKIERKSLDIKDIEALDDLVGLRLVLQFKRDIDTVERIIEQYFEVLEKYDTIDRLKDDQFGYASRHFVIGLPDEWLKVPTLANLKGLRAELQVRTTAQHIWAAASHTLQYKIEESVPFPIRRAINRVSALLETVDLEFERVLEQRDAYRKKINIKQADQVLNVDLLEKVLDSLWPAQNKVDFEDYASLLEDLLKFDIKTTTDLSRIIKKHANAVLERDRLEADSMKASDEYESYTLKERTDNRFYFAHTGLTRAAVGEELGSQWQKYIDEKREQLLRK